MKELTNVRWIVSKSQGDIKVEFPIADSMSKSELIAMFRMKQIRTPSIMADETVLSYDTNSTVRVTVIHKMSDISDVYAVCAINEDIVIASIEDDKDYAFSYIDAMIEAENAGRELSQKSFLDNVRK